MNPNLQNILDIIQQSEKLDAEQKDRLLKAIKDADKELEITAFKLERTEKVKKTTAILLEETIEELEQKRIAVETQNRELEIESALEKVRTIAMGMRQPADMLDVCKTISLQLASLGVKEIRNVQTAIFYEQRGTYMNYEYYAKHDKTIITETVFTNNEIHNEFATKMLKGKGEVFITHIKGSEVKDWIAYQKTTNVFIDKYLEIASSLNYYWFSLGPVALGNSTYHPLTEEEINLFKRFLKVFELAYQRYLDIEQAEAQAREAQIEVSLERVRAVAMSMNKSDDLLSICDACFKEFKKLGFENLRNVIIHIPNEEKKYFMDYDYSDFLGGSINNICYDSHPVVKNYLEQIKKADDAFAEVIVKGKELDSWKDFRQSSGQLDDPRLDGISALYYYLYSIGIGDIGISTLKSIDESQIKILKRFRNVFDLAYRRYNDITLAEAQAREAKIEAALEKVRAAAMSMHKSEDLLNVSEILYNELHKLGFDEMRNAMINIHNDEKETFINYDYSDEIGRSINHLTYNIHPVIEKQIKQIRGANDAFSETSFTGTDLEEWKKFRQKIGEKDDQRIDSISALYYYFYSVGIGSIGISTFSPIGEEKLTLLKRFRNVFSLSYQRYSDLAQAEAQAREAQIELALERVRARTMAMQKSEELKEVIQLVYEQFVHLNINTEHTGFILDYKLRDDFHSWIADKFGSPSQITIPYFACTYYDRFNEAKKNGIDFFAATLSFEEKNRFYEDLFHHIPGFPEESKKIIFNHPGFTISTVLLENVALYIENFSGTPYSDEDNKTLMRFGKVFQQTYTRFLDLQKAEAQAREAQIQLALERVRARSLAMHNTSEMQEVVNIVAQQLYNMNLDINGGVFIAINDEVDKDIPLWASGGAADYVQRVTVPFLNKPVFILLRDAIKKKNNFFTEEHSYEEKVEFFEHLFKFPPWNSLTEQWKQELLSRKGGYTRSVVVSNYTSISITNHNGKKFSEADNEILQRFGNVFEQSYIRFLDLQKAEAQAKEAQIEAALERVRAKAMAMHTPDDLSETVSLFFKELKSLNLLPWRCGVGRIDEDIRTTFLTTTSITKDGEITEVAGKLKQMGHPVLDGIFDHWKQQKEYYPVLRGDDIRKYYEIIKPQIAYPDYPLDAVQYGHNFPFKEGFIFAWTENRLSEDELQIFRRFSSVLSLTYRRYLDLKEAEERNKIIQADNDRKTKELEDARQLQLSMLPKELPKVLNLDIAVYMKTATEVGGDYYDYILDDIGILTFIVGDATGHGMMSGMMVTIMKSFFISNKTKINLKEFFEVTNNSIKDMKLGRLMMALVGIQITPEKLIATNAGMPSLLYFRNKSQKAGEFVSNNLPLGGMKGTQYLLKEIRYEKGDVLLLMSDGFAELKNHNNEQYGYLRIKDKFRSSVHKSSLEIIEDLKSTASEWLNGSEPEDDVTFVVIKIK